MPRRCKFLEMSGRLVAFFLILLFPLFITFAQTKSKKIRGYKIHNSNILVTTDKLKSDRIGKTVVVVNLGKPQISAFSPFAITIDLKPEVTVFGQSGEIDFIVFEDFTVNGFNLRIKEYNEKIKFRRSKLVNLKTPLKIVISTSQIVLGSAIQILRSKKEWRVRGRALVFGRFKKSFLKFKRVIPVDIDLTIKNLWSLK